MLEGGGAFSCFGTQKGGKRIVPASRMPEGNASTAQSNGSQAVAGLTNQATSLAPSLLAPPSSPASFSNSAIPSTAQSPSCFLSLSANSPGRPSSTIPASSLRSLISRTSADCLSSSFPEQEFPPQWDPSISPQNGKCSRIGSGRLFEHDATGSSIGSQDTNFFCPDTFARFYLDQNPLPHAVGRLSVSKDSNVYPTSSSGHQNKQSKSPKQDVEELEAYRASCGFSAAEIITTTQYVEITDVTDDSFTMTSFAIDKPAESTNLQWLPKDRRQGGYRKTLCVI
ncbi:hypothetical protein F3Y22_tig00110458pilonHSYRG00328 [Hibiscus syriacus]|uniref:Uncharacterized protein n=1 Tax=Hibiscus syriacus TaxID=106335 RepID=A0A6A3AM03_HIBSY|nr:hypothetical protein F3Y22_tig00110458pilonHSYRG00328 [Hibiscus syriacus]